MQKEQKDLMQRLNKTAANFDISVSGFGNNGYLIQFPETEDYKEQSFSVIVKEHTIKDFVSMLEDENYDADEVAIFMYKRLRKFDTPLRDAITEAEYRLNKLGLFTASLKD